MVWKYMFDIILSFILLILLSIPMLAIWGITCIISKSNGLFFQKRIGQNGKVFIILKYKTLFFDRKKVNLWSVFLRRSKLDELPQLINIIKGEMSFVGPRPDLPGYYDMLEGENRMILKLKPGLTSEAALKYLNEEKILEMQENPKEYNDNVIFLDKIHMNLKYYNNRTFLLDLKIIIKTLTKIYKTKIILI